MTITARPYRRIKRHARPPAGHTNPVRSQQHGAEPIYETPRGAEHRTLELTVDSSQEMWLLITLTGHAAERLWTSSSLPFEPIAMKLTYRARTFELPEVRWLVNQVLKFDLGSQTLRSAARRTGRSCNRGLRADVLAKVARQLHLYLDDYDLAALLEDIGISKPLARAVRAKAVPPFEDIPAFQAHLAACVQCVGHTYIDDSYLL